MQDVAATRRLLEEQLVVVAVLGSGKKSYAICGMCHTCLRILCSLLKSWEQKKIIIIPWVAEQVVRWSSIQMGLVFASASPFVSNPQKLLLLSNWYSLPRMLQMKPTHWRSDPHFKLLIFAFASAPCRGGSADYWVSSNSSLYDTKRKRLSPGKAEKLLFLKKYIYLSFTLNIN